MGTSSNSFNNTTSSFLSLLTYIILVVLTCKNNNDNNQNSKYMFVNSFSLSGKKLITHQHQHQYYYHHHHHHHHTFLNLSQKNILEEDPIQNKASNEIKTNSGIVFDSLDRRSLLQKSVAISTSTLISNLCIPRSNAAASSTNIPPLLTLPNIKNSNIKIPRVGYSSYKTDKSQIVQCLNLALNNPKLSHVCSCNLTL